MKTNFNRLIPLICATILMTMCASCALFPSQPAEEALRVRIESYMNAKINEDWPKVYSFFDSDFKERTSEQQFITNISKMEFTAFSIESIEMEPDETRATVKIKTDVIVRDFDFKGKTEIQTWIKQGRKWFIYTPPRDPKGPFA